MKYPVGVVKDFLRESNAIEGVFGDEALDDSLKAWKFIEAKSRIAVKDVLELHRILMIRQPLEEKYKGHLRDIDVYVGRWKAMRPNLLRSVLGDWCARASDYREKRDDKKMHVLYEKIHPFVDGNGRTGRILMNWMRLRQHKPILIIKEAKKQEYYEWFRE